MIFKDLITALLELAYEIRSAAKQRKEEFEWVRQHFGFATKQDLKEMENRIMSALTEEFKKVKADIVEGTTELTKKIADLESSLEKDTLSAESREIFEDVKAAAETLASIVPNPETTG